METQFANSTGLAERLIEELQLMRPLLPTYLHLLVSAIFPIYTAAHASLVRPSSAAPIRKKPDDDDEDNEVEEVSSKIETLTPSDAILFPVMAGCTLAGLYFILKFLQDPAWLNWFLGLYFACIGYFFMMRFLQDGFSILRSTLLPRQYSTAGTIWVADIKKKSFVTKVDGPTKTHTSALPGILRAVPLPAGLNNIIWKLRQLAYSKARLEFSIRGLLSFKIPIEALDIVSLILTTAIIGYHTFIDKPWYLTNILGFSFCYGSLQFMTPGTSWTGTLLLSALFFYDIYFVFYTPMMVTVATKLDVPIKLLFPRPDGCILPVGAEEGSEAMKEYLKCIAKKRTMAMLGLGDIVVPGMMLAFALRFDLYLFYLRKTKSTNEKPKYSPATGSWGERFWVSSTQYTQLFRGKRFPKPYFYASVTGYILGMLTTICVMQIANHAQPALLYLVPGVLLSLWGTALIKGDLKLLWEYSEMPVDEKDEAKSKDTPTSTNSTQAESSEKALDVRKYAPEQTSSNIDKITPKEPQPLGPQNHLIYFAVVLPEPNTSLSKPQEDKKAGEQSAKAAIKED